jgi:Phosphotransferase enzyme family
MTNNEDNPPTTMDVRRPPNDEADLTTEFFTETLRRQYGNKCPSVVSVNIRREERGVLSVCLRVHLEFDDEASSTNNYKLEGKSSNNHQRDDLLPSYWIVKLVRDDLNLSWMCRNEHRFYSVFAPALLPSSSSSAKSQHPLPFQIPKYLDGSDSHLILEQVLDVDTVVLVDGCPVDKLGQLLENLAALHATCWQHEFLLSKNTSGDPNHAGAGFDHHSDDALVFPVGMGQRLPKLQKEGLFVRSWEDTLDNMVFEDDVDVDGSSDVRSFARKLCQHLADLRLRDIHDMVHRHRITLVHGDYHVSNWLWPTDRRKPFLVDWATAGMGNPMVDFVFFLVVSTNDDCVTKSKECLQKYFELLLKYNPELSLAINIELLDEMMRWALLCQWLILVSYDAMCRQIAMSEKDAKKREMTARHFNNVNRRTVLAMRSLHDWETTLLILPKATSTEKQEAQDFCERTPLVI